MAEQTKPQTPIKDAKAGIGGLRLTPGTDKSLPRIEVRLSFPLDRETTEWVAYLSRCMMLGYAYVDIRSPQPTLDETPAADEPDPQDGPAEKPSELFPGWPIACGKPVRIEGMNAVCDLGHITTTPFGEPCNHMEHPEVARCAVTWAEDADDRCELEEGHAGAHYFPKGRAQAGDAGTSADPDEMPF